MKMNLNNDEIIKIIATELAYNRFLGMIYGKKQNKQITTITESEKANTLANDNWFLYVEDAIALLDIINGKCNVDNEDFKPKQFETSIGSLDL